MTARILDGTATAAAIKTELRERVSALGEAGIVPGLGTILVGEDPGSHIYVSAKHRDCAEVGIRSLRRDLPASATQTQIEAAVDEFNDDPACTGFLVQLPLPGSVNPQSVLERVDPMKDADGLHPMNLGRLLLGARSLNDLVLPCTPAAILHLMQRHSIDLVGADVVVVGRGPTVGRYLGPLLGAHGIDATVTVTHTASRNLVGHLRRADVIIAAAGVPGMIRADMVKPGAVVVDVGVTRVYDEARGRDRVRGDVAPDVAEVASWISPNPGGVGPMTRVMLLRNVVEAAERAQSEDVVAAR